MKHHQLRNILIGILLVSVSFAGGIWIAPHFGQSTKTTEKAQNLHVAFLQEVRTVIQENYWNNLSETDFVTLHVRAIEKLTAQPLGCLLYTSPSPRDS